MINMILMAYPIEYNVIDYLCNDLAFSFLDALKYLLDEIFVYLFRKVAQK